MSRQKGPRRPQPTFPESTGKDFGRKSGLDFRKRLSRKGDDEAFSWVYGRHAAAAALQNPQRQLRRLLVTSNAAHQITEVLNHAPIPPEIVPAERVAAVLPPAAVHQGIAVEASQPPELSLEDLLQDTAVSTDPHQTLPLLLLDRVTDPQNVGTILRTAAAFGATGIVLTRRHAPILSGALAKAASGALDQVPIARVTNLARALDLVADAGWYRIGLAAETTTMLSAVKPDRPVALVLGAEATGLRRLTAERCDVLAALPTRPDMPSLNVAAAGATALYEFARRRLPA